MAGKAKYWLVLIVIRSLKYTQRVHVLCIFWLKYYALPFSPNPFLFSILLGWPFHTASFFITGAASETKAKLWVWFDWMGEERSDPGMWFSGARPGRGEAGRGEKKKLDECEESPTTANLNVSLTGQEDLSWCWQRRWKKSHIFLKTSHVFSLLLRDSGSREVEPSCPSCNALYLTPHKFSLQECRVTAS